MQTATAASAPQYSPDPTLTPQQHHIISLLAAGHSITQAAAQENLHRNTVGYWRRTIPAFARELEFATREQRLYWHEQATALAPEAIRVIQETLTSPDSSPSLRFRAATTILKMATSTPWRPRHGFPDLPTELEAISGQMLAKQNQQPEPRPQPEPEPEAASEPTPDLPTEENFDIVQAARNWNAAQNCTKPAQQPVRSAPQPGRNSPCSCGSGLKFKRCCAK